MIQQEPSTLFTSARVDSVYCDRGIGLTKVNNRPHKLYKGMQARLDARYACWWRPNHGAQPTKEYGDRALRLEGPYARLKSVLRITGDMQKQHRLKPRQRLFGWMTACLLVGSPTRPPHCRLGRKRTPRPALYLGASSSFCCVHAHALATYVCGRSTTTTTTLLVRWPVNAGRSAPSASCHSLNKSTTWEGLTACCYGYVGSRHAPLYGIDEQERSFASD